MKLWMRRTLTSSIVLFLILVASILLFTRTEAYAQFLDSYNSLSKPEQRWVLRHPIAAFRTHKLATSARTEAVSHNSDPDLDGDLNGGMVDAFKHTLWMALTAQKIGYSKAVSLGIAHEEGNRAEFDANPERNGGLIQDQMASDMDLFNNQVGARIGADNPNVSYDVLVFLVKDAVVKGQCRKLRKDSSGNYLDSTGTVIILSDYNGVWLIPKQLIPSNKQ